VGYDNSKQAWLVKNSWGDGWASEGYGWVSFSAPGMCDSDNTYGFTFTPKQPTAVVKPRLTLVPGRTGCYRYTAAPGDYPEGVASQFGVKLQQLLLDNLAVLQDPSTVPPGAALVLCGVSSAALARATVTTGGQSSTQVAPVQAPVPKPPGRPPLAAVKPAVAAGRPPVGTAKPSVVVSPRPSAVLPQSKPQAVTPVSTSRPPMVAATPLALPAVVQTPTTRTSSSAEEVAALLAIKQVLDPAGTGTKDWQPGSSSACGWIGVTCDASGGRVTFLRSYTFKSLDPPVGDFRQLSGRLPSGALLRRLPALKGIDWPNATLTGSLPSDWSQLTQLVGISLDDNELTGGQWASVHVGCCTCIKLQCSDMKPVWCSGVDLLACCVPR
jgi:hypothetical protein